MELEGTANCGGEKSKKVSALSGRSSTAGGGPLGWLVCGGKRWPWVPVRGGCEGTPDPWVGYGGVRLGATVKSGGG